MSVTRAETRWREHKEHCPKCPRCKEGRNLRFAVEFQADLKRQREYTKEMQRINDLPDYDRPASYRKPLPIMPTPKR